MRVYLAAPLFTDGEREFNLTLTKKLEAGGYTVFFPQRDAPQFDMSSGYAARLFQANLAGLQRSDVVVAVCDGMPMDDGTAWEVGYALGRGMPVIGVRTDTRLVGPEERVNLMIQESVIALVESAEAVLLRLSEVKGSRAGDNHLDPVGERMKRAEAPTIRREIVSAMIGVLIGLAFSMLADTIKDPIKEYFGKHQLSVAEVYPLLWTDTFIMVVLFVLTTLSFFVGTQTYLRARAESRDPWWVWDFVFTIITLGSLAGLGILVKATRPFVQGLGIFYGIQIVWAIPHLRDSDPLPRLWAVCDLVTCVLTLFFASNAKLGVGALVGVVVVHVSRFVAEGLLLRRFGGVSTS